ncbi:MAG: COX15/CtaA family protein [Methylacidiphilales bacterium]|nr:COX15/CtaA family protein [Candidatus Methylacidiphilales bacterium]
MHAPIAAPPAAPPCEAPRPRYNWGLHRYACFCAGSILFLICLGGLVTSNEAGMSVPDWPNTYGYNMFFFPWQKWVGGIFYEHSHRLVASGVGVLVSLLAIWLCFQPRIWLRWMGICVPIFIAFEAVLGGLRVVLSENQLGIFHGSLAQLLLVAVSLIALFTSRWWLGIYPCRRPVVPSRWTGLTLAVCVLIFTQLVLGATMRHQHAGLAIHDFPLAYGRLWPQADPDSIDAYNRVRASNEPATSALAIELQMVHRLAAVLIVLSIFALAAKMWLTPGSAHILRRWSAAWAGLVLIQFVLGACTVWTDKAADVATAHVAVGALTLVLGVLLCAMSWRLQSPEELATSVAP